ncbi:hypothetical protein [Microbacterium sp. GXF6406]
METPEGDVAVATGRQRRLLPLIGGLLAVLAVGAGIALVAPMLMNPQGSDDDALIAETDPADEDNVSEDPLSSISAPAVGPLGSDEDAEIQRATDAIDAVVAATDEIAQRGDGSAVGLEQITTGWVLGELQAKAREQYDLGYVQSGEAKVTSVSSSEIDLSATPASITFKVCIDVSDIEVSDAAGNSLTGALYNPGHPVAHIYGAVFDDDMWKISTHDIPDVQDCTTV